MPMRVFVPRTASAQAQARVIAHVLDEAAAGALRDFQSTTATWQHKPGFAVEAPSPDGRLVGTDDEIYGYVNGGTRAHTIRPRKKRLRFPSKFRAKTRPGALRSTRGSRGGPVVFARAVRHPGTKARHFDEAIAAKWQRRIPGLIRQAIASTSSE